MQSISHIIKDKSNSLIEKELTSSNSLIDTTLKNNSDVVEQQWVARHAKLIYKIGIDRYLQLADKARKYGNNPRALMGHLVAKELTDMS